MHRAPAWIAALVLVGGLVLLLAAGARADVSQVSADPSSPSNAAGARTSYAVAFKTSASGGVSGGGEIKGHLPGRDRDLVVLLGTGLRHDGRPHRRHRHLHDQRPAGDVRPLRRGVDPW